MSSRQSPTRACWKVHNANVLASDTRRYQRSGHFGSSLRRRLRHLEHGSSHRQSLPRMEQWNLSDVDAKRHMPLSRFQTGPEFLHYRQEDARGDVRLSERVETVRSTL